MKSMAIAGLVFSAEGVGARFGNHRHVARLFAKVITKISTCNPAISRLAA